MTDWATTAITAWEQGEYGTLEESRAAHRAMLRKVKADGYREAASIINDVEARRGNFLSSSIGLMILQADKIEKGEA